MSSRRKGKIALLNDLFRGSMSARLGSVVITPGIREIFESDILKQFALMAAIQKFDAFTNDNDPHKEHDFGSILFDGQNVFWKIDYYERGSNFEAGAEDPSNEVTTHRVLTIMLALEY